MRSQDKKSAQASKPLKKDLKKKSEIITPSFTPEDLIKLGKQYAGLESPIDLSFPIFTEAYLRPLEWVNFEKNPKRMKISNSGTTAILSAKWHGPRPYLTKGPLTGYYVFSQLHFHWGSNLDEGSEHTMDGKSLPLEVHVMFFKNTYLTQEDAMKQTDGTVTVAYLFTLQSTDNEDFNPIISALKEIQKPLTSHHLELLPLEKFLHAFADDYFMYWGNVVNRSILWLISRKPLGISARQLSLFHSMTGINEKPITKNFRGTKEINHRIVYHINPSKFRGDLILGQRDSKFNKNKNFTVACNVAVKNSVGTGDEKLKNNETSRDCLEEIISENETNQSILINLAVHTDERSENTIYSGVGMADEISSLVTSANNEDKSLEKRRKSQIKFQLASALLSLEKEEGNDYGLLEKYLESKFDTFQDEQCYDEPLSDEKLGEEMLHPSVRSLQMNLYEEFDACVISTLNDNCKSDPLCFKNSITSEADSDPEKISIEESNKSRWSLIKSTCEKEDMEEDIFPLRPKTCAARLENSSCDMADDVGGNALVLRSPSKMSHVPPPPINRAVLIKKPSSEGQRAKKGILRDTYKKSPESIVDEARAKIRSSLEQSMWKLGKMRGTPSKIPTPTRSSKPAWRY